MKITTDHKWKQFIYGYELTPKERKEFDYMSDEEIDSPKFLRYKGWVYSINDFISTENFPGWHGYKSDSYFSGVLIELSKDGESYRIGTIIS